MSSDKTGSRRRVRPARRFDGLDLIDSLDRACVEPPDCPTKPEVPEAQRLPTGPRNYGISQEEYRAAIEILLSQTLAGIPFRWTPQDSYRRANVSMDTLTLRRREDIPEVTYQTITVSQASASYENDFDVPVATTLAMFSTNRRALGELSSFMAMCGAGIPGQIDVLVFSRRAFLIVLTTDGLYYAGLHGAIGWISQDEWRQLGIQHPVFRDRDSVLWRFGN